MPQNGTFGFIEVNAKRQIMNYILLIFKYYVYKAREDSKLSLQSLIARINKIRKTENIIRSKEL